ERPHDGAQWLNERGWITRGLDDDGHLPRRVVRIPRRLRVREVHSRLWRIVVAARSKVADDADDRHGGRAPAKAYALTNRTLTGPLRFGELPAHDHHRRGILAIRRGEVASRHERESHRREVARCDVLRHGRRPTDLAVASSL